MNPGYSVAVEMLPMPRVTTLQPEQIEGTVCVWCASTPNLGLGPRISVMGGALARWFPRACTTCAATEAGRVVAIHIRSCHRCTSRAYCQDARALHALAAKSPFTGAAPHPDGGGRDARGWGERP